MEATGTKVCVKCGQEKPIQQFHIDRSLPDSRKARCRLCTNEVKAKWRLRNRDLVLSQKRRSYERNREKYITYFRSDKRRSSFFSWRLRRQFGITVQRFEDLMEAQGGCCAICGLPPDDANGHRHKHRLHIDHDHETGVVRGLLCNNCNAGLGYFRDSEDFLMSAVNYLSKTKLTQEEF